MEIEATGVEFKKGQQTDTCYFTGGLLAHPLTDDHLLLAPVGFNTDGFMGYRMTWEQVLQTVMACGCVMLGVNQRHDTGTPTRSEVWRPDVPFSVNRLHASDSWGVLSHVAQTQQDAPFAQVARYLSVCIEAAGVRLRELGDAHHEQLRWALSGGGKKPGGRFSNTAMTELHLAFHSLAGELCSARDHLARIAAIGCGAKESIDSMAWLEKWLSKPVNAANVSQPLVALLVQQMGTKDNPGWLRHLGEFRNAVMHRRPMGADPAAGGLSVRESATLAGPVRTIRLAPIDGSEPGPDPFIELASLYKRFEILALQATNLVPYQVEIPTVVVR